MGLQDVSNFGRPQVARLTLNLAQVAGTYDAGTVSGGAILIDIQKLAIYVATVGATLTSVSLQTNQTNSTILMSAVEGAVANLIVQKNIVRAIPVIGGLYLASGQKLQYTIVGATGTGSLLVTVPFQAVDNGATIA